MELAPPLFVMTIWIALFCIRYKYLNNVSVEFRDRRVKQLKDCCLHMISTILILCVPNLLHYFQNCEYGEIYKMISDIITKYSIVIFFINYFIIGIFGFGNIIMLLPNSMYLTKSNRCGGDS